MKELEDFTSAEVKAINDSIDSMSQEDMCRLWRFSTSDNPILRGDLPFYARFKEKFNKLGGFTPEISKRIGW